MQRLPIFLTILLFTCLSLAQTVDRSQSAADSAFMELEQELAKDKNAAQPLIADSTTRETVPQTAIAVLQLNANNVNESDANALTDRLRIELFRASVYQVMEREQMQGILSEMQFQMSGCTSTECAVEVGKLIGVQKMVAGSVGKVGEYYTVSIRLIDVTTGAIENTATVDLEGSLGQVLTEAIPAVAYEISGVEWIAPRPEKESEKQPETIASGFVIITNPAGANLFINQALVGISPLTWHAEPGEYTLRVVKEGYSPWEKQYTVYADSISDISILLTKKVIVEARTAIRIMSEPGGATIYLNGVMKGYTPKELDVSPNVVHNLRLAKPDCKNWERTYKVEKGQILDISAVLPPKSTAIVPPPQSEPVDNTKPAPAKTSTPKRKLILKGFQIRYVNTDLEETLNSRITDINSALLDNPSLFKEAITESGLQFVQIEDYSGIELYNLRQIGDIMSLDFGLGFYHAELISWVTDLFENDTDRESDYHLETWNPQINLNLRLSPIHFLFFYPYLNVGAGYDVLMMTAYDNNDAIGGPIYHSYSLHYGAGLEFRIFHAIGFAVDVRRQYQDMQIMDLGEVTDRFRDIGLDTIDMGGVNVGISLYIYH